MGSYCAEHHNTCESIYWQELLSNEGIMFPI